MEPTPQDIQAVGEAIGQQPAPQQQPPAPTPQPAPTQQPAPQPAEPQQPAQPTEPSPAPQPQDPFSQMFAPEQPAPQEPTQPNPAQPTEPTPTPQPQTPAEPSQPTAPQPEQFQSFDDYMNEVLGDVGKPKDMPDPNKIDPNDVEGIKGFFDELVNTAVERAKAETTRSQAIQNAERRQWDNAFEKYPTLRTNKDVRDMVHAIRMGEFRKGVAITPTQAAEKLLSAMNSRYKQGVVDNQVQTTITQVQPTGGGSQQVPTGGGTQATLESLQTGGEVALADYLDAEIKAGRI